MKQIIHQKMINHEYQFQILDSNEYMEYSVELYR